MVRLDYGAPFVEDARAFDKPTRDKLAGYLKWVEANFDADPRPPQIFELPFPRGVSKRA